MTPEELNEANLAAFESILSQVWDDLFAPCPERKKILESVGEKNQPIEEAADE